CARSEFITPYFDYW
nr:immunoglobulin heavy chain junction region [Mus musculus]